MLQNSTTEFHYMDYILEQSISHKMIPFKTLKTDSLDTFTSYFIVRIERFCHNALQSKNCQTVTASQNTHFRLLMIHLEFKIPHFHPVYS